MTYCLSAYADAQTMPAQQIEREMQAIGEHLLANYDERWEIDQVHDLMRKRRAFAKALKERWNLQ